MEFKNKVVVVTGGARGIGKSLNSVCSGFDGFLFCFGCDS